MNYELLRCLNTGECNYARLEEVIIKLLSNYVKRLKIILNNFRRHLTQIEDRESREGYRNIRQ